MSDPDISGYIDIVSGTEIIGWLLDHPAEAKKEAITVTMDGTIAHTVSANLYRSDVLNAGHPDGRAGFQFNVPEPFCDGREHKVEFFDLAENPILLVNVLTASVSSSLTFISTNKERTTPHVSNRVILMVDTIDDKAISGWAYSEANPLEPVSVALLIDRKLAATALCNRVREDVLRAGHPSDRVGFSFPIPRAYYDNLFHRIHFRAENDHALLVISAERYRNGVLGFRVGPETYVGRVDGLHDGAIRGWALRHDRATDARTGGLRVLVSLQGQPIAELTANHFRADVAQEHDASPNCGFVFVPPEAFFAGRTVELRFRTIPGAIELENSPYRAAFPDLDTYRALRDLVSAADTLFTQMWSLRNKLKGLLPGEPYNLLTYDRWARDYYRALSAAPPRALARTAKEPRDVLVSIICPTYRPRLEDFIAAVESVVNQTYTNWELLIVDDASDSPELTACIEAFVSRDKRIRAESCSENGGISNATNIGLSMAKGRYVALFDHDDLMVDRALEFMLHAALATGAKMLYCDEDKIDDAGTYAEPNLKPDWNYRLLLAQNYVCHLLFVEREHLMKAGLLRKDYDGAQDHDLILRLAEITPPAHIHHVAELLYHWRKTPFSTASSCKTKSYAVAAGIRAVSDHLDRRGLDAEVTSPLDITVYDIRWRLAREPKVTIIIPYREHVAMTRECLDALRAVTSYRNYEILLMDNWSTSDDALAFAEEQGALAATRVIRVEEPFNYSRINNIAVAASDGEFLLFLNNDVVVNDADWLTQMMGEALADERVGIVGNKLLYPSGLVQHGGIILGVGGIADHAHRGLAANAPGYMARAICAQDLSAVTAACMLCRREVFEAVGAFDEQDLAVAFNDVDLCLKAGALGYRVVWTPGSVAEHRESLSRGSDFRPEHQARFFHENQVMENRWAVKLALDVHYNKHFSRRSGIFIDLNGT